MAILHKRIKPNTSIEIDRWTIKRGVSESLFISLDEQEFSPFKKTTLGNMEAHVVVCSEGHFHYIHLDGKPLPKYMYGIMNKASKEFMEVIETGNDSKINWVVEPTLACLYNTEDEAFLMEDWLLQFDTGINTIPVSLEVSDLPEDLQLLIQSD